MIEAEKNDNTQQQLICQYMRDPNHKWAQIIDHSSRNNNFLTEQEPLRLLIDVLKTNNRACVSLKHKYIYQLSNIFTDMMNIYSLIANHIKSAVSQNQDAIRDEIVKDMRSVKKEIVLLITEWINHCHQEDQIRVLQDNMLEDLFKATLDDYCQSAIPTREAEVINMTCSIITKLGNNIQNYLTPILATIFEPTMQMISTTQSEFPDHRTYFFKFLSAINQYAFKSMLALKPEQFKLLLDAIIWGMKQMMQECKETSIKIMENLLDNVGDDHLINYWGDF